MKPLSESLIKNSKSAIISSIELHNKPVFSYRYEICTILVINGWELILKAFINENYPEVKLIRKDGTTKSFEECVNFVSSEGSTGICVNRGLIYQKKIVWQT